MAVKNNDFYLKYNTKNAYLVMILPATGAKSGERRFSLADGSISQVYNARFTC